MPDETPSKAAPKKPTLTSLKTENTKLSNRIVSLQTEADDAIKAQETAESAAYAAVKATEVVQTQLDAAIAQAQEDQALIGRLGAAKQELIESHRRLEIVHEQSIAAAAAKSDLTEVPYGSVRANGLLVLAGADMVDTRWRKPQEARSGYAVDIVGPKAEFLARRARQPYAKLPDGTWRVSVPDQRQAFTIMGGIKAYLAKHADGTRASAAPLAATSLQALDSCRAANHGIVTIDGHPQMAALRGSDMMALSVMNDANGRMVGLLVKPS